MKRIGWIALAALLMFAGCAKTNNTATEETEMPKQNGIDGTYVYAPAGTGGVYGEYVIDTEAGKLTVNEVNIFDEPYRKDGVIVETLEADGAYWKSEDGVLYSEGANGSLAVNGGRVTLQRVIEPKAAQKDLKNPIATVTMADGKTMTLELYPSIAPTSVANFVTLANSGFYDGLKFHRIYAGFMIQGGCPKGNGTGDPGYSIRGEFAANGFVQNNLSHKRGVISMARSSAYDSAGSQFFIMHKDTASLNAQYAAFGMLIDGFDTLDAIAATPVTAGANGEKSQPLEDVVIASIRVETFGADYSNFEKIN